MSFSSDWYRQRLRKIGKRGFRGFPVATVAYYGPDETRASKVAVGIVPYEGGEVTLLERWFSETGDIRLDPSVCEAILSFVRQHGAKSVAFRERILGCPHEEGIDYREGEKCPQCPYWSKRDRWSGEVVE
jgi:hypothetical protein